MRILFEGVMFVVASVGRLWGLKVQTSTLGVFCSQVPGVPGVPLMDQSLGLNHLKSQCMIVVCICAPTLALLWGVRLD